MRNIKDTFKVLEEGVLDDFEFDSEMVAQPMENTSTWKLRWICCNLIVIVSLDLWVQVALKKLLSLFRFNEKQVQKINKAFFELL